MKFELHFGGVLDRNAIGHLMCREQRSQLAQAIPLQHGEFERLSLPFTILEGYIVILIRFAYLFATNNRLMGRECGDDDIGVSPG